MDDDLKFAGRRDRVRSNIIEPLEAIGLRKSKAMTIEQFEAFKDRLAEQLAWLSEEWHDALRETIQLNAEPSARQRKIGGRPARDIWPSEVAIVNWARALSPMSGVTKLIGTYMRSRAGRDAMATSVCLASRLEAYLRKHGRPPTEDGAWDIMREEAVDLGRRIDILRSDVLHNPDDQIAARHLNRWEARVVYLQHLVSGDLDQCPELAA